MKLRAIGYLLLVSAVLLFMGGREFCEGKPSERAGSASAAELNVRDFGATGDGKTDDTAAFQAALDEVNRRIKRISPYRVKTTWQATYPELTVPRGTYRISSPLRISRAILLKGESGSLVRQTNPEQPVFLINPALRICIEGLEVEGGSHALHFFTHNSGGAILTVRNCAFRASGDYAIECIVKGKKGDYSGYFKESEEGPHGRNYRKVENPDHSYDFNSTLLDIENCRFENAAGVLHTNADMATLRDCQITGKLRPDRPMIKKIGFLTIESPTVHLELDAAGSHHFIEAEGGLFSIRNATVFLSGNPKANFDFIRNLGKYRNTQPGGIQRTVVVQDNEFSVTGCRLQSVVHCVELPNMAVIEGCSVDSPFSVKAIAFGEGASEAVSGISPDGIALVCPEPQKGLTVEWPEALRPHVQEALPLEARRRAFDPGKIEAPPQPGRGVNLSDFGAVGDGETDAGEAFRQALEALKDEPFPVIHVAPGEYLLSEPVVLPARVAIIGKGMAYFRASAPGNAGNALFEIPRGESVLLRHLTFARCGAAIGFNAGESGPARLWIDRCIFANISDTAIRFKGRAEGEGANRPTQLVVENCILSYEVRRLVDSDASMAMIRSSWAFNDPEMQGAAMVNTGTMFLRNILANPGRGDAMENDQRWIDNSGRLVASEVRFSGEAGGFCAVNQIAGKSRATSLAIQNSMLYTLKNRKRPAWVFLEEIPAALILQNNSGLTGRQHPVALSAAATESLASIKRAWYQASANTVPPFLP